MAARFLRTALCLAPTLVALGTSSAAFAQGIVLPTVLSRSTGLRNTKQMPYWVSYADCVKDDVLQFKAVTFTGNYIGNALQVWAGSTDCTDRAARIGSATSCWLVFQDTILNAPREIDIHSRDIAAKNLYTSTVKGPGSGTLADCDKGTEPPLALTLYFMFEQNDGILGTAATWTATHLDITRPVPPTDVKASPGETRIHLSWTNTLVDQDVVEYRFFCDPPRGTSTTAAALGAWTSDASAIGQTRQLLEAGLGGTTSWLDGAVLGTGGAGGTGGSDAGSTTTQQSCVTGGPLTTGAVPDATYQCGSVAGRISHDGTADGLTNGVDYAVAIASVDQVGNVGKLSANQCATPVNVTDFFELYRLDGGKGGGLCSFGPPSRRMPLVPLSVASLVIGVSMLRRRRK